MTNISEKYTALSHVVISLTPDYITTNMWPVKIASSLEKSLDNVICCRLGFEEPDTHCTVTPTTVHEALDQNKNY